jgi:hypothetical protein
VILAIGCGKKSSGETIPLSNAAITRYSRGKAIPQANSALRCHSVQLCNISAYVFSDSAIALEHYSCAEPKFLDKPHNALAGNAQHQFRFATQKDGRGMRIVHVFWLEARTELIFMGLWAAFIGVVQYSTTDCVCERRVFDSSFV